jgi:hypothetical protein
VVKNNFTLVIYIIILVSITPILAEFAKKLLARRR